MDRAMMPNPVAVMWEECGEYQMPTRRLEMWPPFEPLTIFDALITTDQAEAYAAAKVREAIGWISVEDRLPPNDENDVIALHGGSETEIVWGWLIHETHVDKTYSHWMPLPPPPSNP
jgi:hypothetical protein